MSCEATEDIPHKRQAVDALRQSYQSQAERGDLLNLIQVLMPHPGGLRRWSVMRDRTLRDALFHLPKEKAGEVWAANVHLARVWLKAETGVNVR